MGDRWRWDSMSRWKSGADRAHPSISIVLDSVCVCGIYSICSGELFYRYEYGGSGEEEMRDIIHNTAGNRPYHI